MMMNCSYNKIVIVSKDESVSFVYTPVWKKPVRNTP